MPSSLYRVADAIYRHYSKRPRLSPQAHLISAVTSADFTMLLVYLRRRVSSRRVAFMRLLLNRQLPNLPSPEAAVSNGHVAVEQRLPLYVDSRALVYLSRRM